MSPMQPSDLIQKEFSTSGVGYDRDQVRTFLSNVAKSWEELDARDPTRHIETLIAAILAEARYTARVTIDDALDEAAETRRKTLVSLEELKWRASGEISRARIEAVERAQQILGTSAPEPERDVPEDKIEGLAQKQSQLDAAVRTVTKFRRELRRLKSVSGSLRKILDSGWAEGDRPIRVVIVCTWNRFRSPIAAEILKREAAELGCENLVVSSRGTEASLGYAPPSVVVNHAGRQGIDITGHRSRRLSRADVILADLVVVMEQRHADVVRELHPWANLVLLGQLPDATVDSAQMTRDGFAALAQQNSRMSGREILEPSGRFNRKSFERYVEQMTPHLHVLAQIIACLGTEMDCHGRGGFAFTKVAEEKGAEYAANS